MKRFHVHLHVDDLQASLAFYSRLFGAEPARVESDYAKWMLDDPRINFAISTRGSKPGLDHFGFQADSAAELAGMKQAAEDAQMALLDEGQTSCCYARSEKHWIIDPSGVPWEHFHTLADIPVFNEAAAAAGTACCAPAPANAQAASACCTPAPVKEQAVSACCTPAVPKQATPACCGPSTTSRCC